MATLLTVTPLLPAGPSLADGLRFYVEQLGFAITWQAGEMAGVRRGSVAFNLVQNSNREWADNASASIALMRCMESTERPGARGSGRWR